MIEFDKYFLTECNIFLHHVDYDHLSMGGEPKLTITDQIGAYDVAEDKVRIEISRSVNAAPGQLFSLRVVFGVLLTKNPLVMELDQSVHQNLHFRYCRQIRRPELVGFYCILHTFLPIPEE